MRRVVAAVVLAFAASAAACYATDRRIAAADLGDVQRVRIVAMAAPPLLLAPEPYGATLTQWGVGLPFPPLALLGGMIVAVDLPASIERADAAASELECELRAAASWLPTRALAELLRARLQSAHTDWGIAIADGIVAVPELVDAARTWHMTNWITPVRHWYADEGPQPALPLPPPRELEVAVALTNFEVYRGSLILQLLVKASDGGRVYGRARSVATRPLPPSAGVVADDAAAIRAAIESAGGEALDVVLDALGLALPQPQSPAQ